MSHSASRSSIQLGHICDITLGKMLQPSPNGPYDREVPYLRSGSLDCLGHPDAWRTMYCGPDELRAYRLRVGDLLVAEGGDVGRAEFVFEPLADAIFQNSLHRLRLRADGDLRFVRYALESVRLSGWLDVLCNKTTFGHLTVEKLRQLRIPWPSPAEQTAIVEHLCIEQARIDALLGRKHRVIELLGERRLLLAEQTLTDMLLWEQVVPLKRLVTESNERHGSKRQPTILSVSIHQGVVPRGNIFDTGSRASEFSGYKICRPGDIVVNRMRAFQGGVGVVCQEGVVSPDYTVLRVRDQVASGYLHFVMRSPWFVSEMARRLRGIGSTNQAQVRTPRINFAELGEIGIPIPPRRSQEDLVSELASKEAAIANMIDSQNRQVRLLLERWRTLVTRAISR